MILVHQDMGDIPDTARGCVLAIGNFDGVHAGHRRVIAEAETLARAQGAPLAAMTFEPHPREVLKPTGHPFRLTPLEVKQQILNDLGVKHLFVPAFDGKFSMLSAEGFMRLLKEDLGVRTVVTGEDFRFGKQAAGDVALLRQKFHVHAVAPLSTPDGMAYSSTRIRAAIQKADFKTAAQLLGWKWHIESPVIHGNKRGRTLGMPTANQKTGYYLHMPYGVYAVEAQIEGDHKWHKAVANFGIRPMFEVKEPLLETHLFDFNGDLYGKILRVRPVQYLRGEAKFDSLDALVVQMKEDCQQARAILNS